MATHHILSFPPFQLDVGSYELRRERVVLPLRPKAFTVLRYLAERPGQLVTRAELMQAGWGATKVSEGVLRGCLWELRQALDDSLDSPRFIETVVRQGWRFIATATDHAAPVADSPFKVPSSDTQDLALRTQHSVLVGRESELTQLQGWLAKALQGERQIVFVTGEPGIGKTALVEAFMAQLANDPRVWVAHGQCIEHYGADEAYLPVLAALERLCLRHADAALLNLLRRYAPLWLLQMPSLLKSEELADLQRQLAGTTRDRMLRELASLLHELAAGQLVVLVLEDLHWADPSTIALLAYLARQPKPAPLLVLGTYRPQETVAYAHPLRGAVQELLVHDQCTELRLTGLSQEAVLAYLARRFPRGGATARLTEALYRRSEGNPLFLITIVEALLDQGLLTKEGDDCQVSLPLVDLPQYLPDTLRQLLTRQSATMSENERQVLEAGSVVGAEFSSTLVAAALGIDILEVEEQCENLVDRHQMLQHAGVQEWHDGTVGARYGFRHGLYREFWHEPIDDTRRRRWHRQIGERLETAYGAQADEVAAELALRFEQGQDDQRAIRYFGVAGRNSIQRYAATEAIHYLTRGLDLLKSQPETPERARQELELQVRLGLALVSTKGFALPEVQAAYTRAHALCRQLENSAYLFPVLEGLHSFYAVRGEFQTALTLGEQMLDLACNTQEPALLLEAHHVLGDTLLMSGDSQRARAHLEQGLTLYDRRQHGNHALLYSGHDPGVCCSSYLAFALWFLGYPDQALQHSQQALNLAQEGAHPYSMALALHLSAYFHQLRREVAETQAQAEATLALATAQDFPYWIVLGTIMRGWTFAERQQSQAAVAQIQYGLAACRAMGAEVALSGFLSCLAEAQACAGQPEEGLATIDEALAHVARTGERYYEAELYRLKGELLLAQIEVHAKERRKATNSRIRDNGAIES